MLHEKYFVTWFDAKSLYVNCKFVNSVKFSDDFQIFSFDLWFEHAIKRVIAKKGEIN